MTSVDDTYESLLQLPRHPLIREKVGEEINALTNGLTNNGLFSQRDSLIRAIQQYISYVNSETPENALEEFPFLEQHIIGMLGSIGESDKRAEIRTHPSIIDFR